MFCQSNPYPFYNPQQAKTSLKSSALLAACLRLAHTVIVTNEADKIYLLGPLLFWACAEMTCGFFIFSIPCLSKMVMESGFPRKIQIAFGTGAGTSSSPSYECSNSLPRQKPWKKNKIETTWPRLGDYDIPLRSPGTSESQEQLYPALSLEPVEPIEPGHVLHTTTVTVSEDNSTGIGLCPSIMSRAGKS